MSPRRVAVLVSGSVQGVFFRSATAERAERLGLTGWVRNLPDGRVEAEFQGPAEAVEEILLFCARGPAGATVEDVEVRDVDAREGDALFAVR
jgi:acylphosphatase